MVQLLKDKKEKIQTSCSECNGKGCQVCAEKFGIYYKMANAGVPTKFYEFELNDYTRCSTAKEKIVKYLSKIKEANKRGIGLYLYGDRGLGKSLIESIIIKEALRKGYTAQYTTLGETVMMFGDGFYNREARDLYQKKVLQVDFLVIDDIDKTFKSEKSNYVPAAFDQLIRTRCNELLPTIVSSNQKKSEIFSQKDSFCASALSLLAEHLLEVTFLGQDKRIKEISPQIKKDFFGE